MRRNLASWVMKVFDVMHTTRDVLVSKMFLRSSKSRTISNHLYSLMSRAHLRMSVHYSKSPGEGVPRMYSWQCS